jgi:hypothetical protein
MASAASAQVRIGLNFTGSNRANSGLIPPDTMGAVGPNHIVELNNGRFAVYDKQDGALITDQSHNAFWTAAGVPPVNYAFDPRIIYDHSVGRWFAVAVDNHGLANQFLVGVSSGADPSGAWQAIGLQSDGDQMQWADFPTLGVNSVGVFIAANMVSIDTGGFHSSSVLSIPKSDLTGNPPAALRASLLENITDGRYSQQPAVDLDNSGLPLPIVGVSRSVPNAFFYHSQIEGSILRPTLGSHEFPLVSSFAPPPNARQPAIGGPQKAPLHAGSDRFASNVVVQNDRLWAVQAVSFQTRAAVRWFEIDPSTADIIQTGLVTDPALDFIYPSIAVNDTGDVVIGMSGSSPTQPASSYAVVGETDGGVTTFGSPLLLKAGVDDYEVFDTSSRNRWGDYSATVVDPSDPNSFWTFQQFVSGDNQWAIQITQLLVGESSPIPGDANGDSVVDRTDVAIVMANYGQQNASFEQGNFNNDGKVGTADLILLQANLTVAPGGSAVVPEPPAIILSVVVILCLTATQRGARRPRCASISALP